MLGPEEGSSETSSGGEDPGRAPRWVRVSLRTGAGLVPDLRRSLWRHWNAVGAIARRRGANRRSTGPATAGCSAAVVVVGARHQVGVEAVRRYNLGLRRRWSMQDSAPRLAGRQRLCPQRLADCPARTASATRRPPGAPTAYLDGLSLSIVGGVKSTVRDRGHDEEERRSHGRGVLRRLGS